jgi:tetratricopeptide (TPR) repeat protein
MTIFFSSEPPPADPQLAELWHLLENEYFPDAMRLAENACQRPNARIELFCGLSLAYGESGYYAEAEQVARTAISFREKHWQARRVLAAALMHQGRFLGALDTLGFHRSPPEIYVVRAQIEKMGGYLDGLQVTLEDALELDVPPAIHLYLAYLYGALAKEVPQWSGEGNGFAEVVRYGAYLDVWERDAARHKNTPYGQHLSQHVTAIHRLLNKGR